MSDMNAEPSDRPSIAAAVDKEIYRRRRLLRLFTGLLAVPLLAALGFGFFGRSDAQMVQQEVQSQVAPVKKELASLPHIDELKAVQERVSGLPAQIASLRDEVQKVNDLGGRVEQDRAAINMQAQRFSSIEARQAEMENTLKKLEEIPTAKDIPALKEQIHNDQERIKVLILENVKLKRECSGLQEKTPGISQ